MGLYEVTNVSKYPIYIYGLKLPAGATRIMRLTYDQFVILSRNPSLNVVPIGGEAKSKAEVAETTQSAPEVKVSIDDRIASMDAPTITVPVETKESTTAENIGYSQGDTFNTLILEHAGDNGKLSSKEIKEIEEANPGFKDFLKKLSNEKPEDVTFVPGGHVRFSKGFLDGLKANG